MHAHKLRTAGVSVYAAVSASAHASAHCSSLQHAVNTHAHTRARAPVAHQHWLASAEHDAHLLVELCCLRKATCVPSHSHSHTHTHLHHPDRNITPRHHEMRHARRVKHGQVRHAERFGDRAGCDMRLRHACVTIHIYTSSTAYMRLSAVALSNPVSAIVVACTRSSSSCVQVLQPYIAHSIKPRCGHMHALNWQSDSSRTKQCAAVALPLTQCTRTLCRTWTARAACCLRCIAATTRTTRLMTHAHWPVDGGGDG
jgi:hypothetical protein